MPRNVSDNKRYGTCSCNHKNKKEHLFPRLNDTSDLFLGCVGCVPVIGAKSGICLSIKFDHACFVQFALMLLKKT